MRWLLWSRSQQIATSSLWTLLRPRSTWSDGPTPRETCGTSLRLLRRRRKNLPNLWDLLRQEDGKEGQDIGMQDRARSPSRPKIYFRRGSRRVCRQDNSRCQFYSFPAETRVLQKIRSWFVKETNHQPHAVNVWCRYGFNPHWRITIQSSIGTKSSHKTRSHSHHWR